MKNCFVILCFVGVLFSVSCGSSSKKLEPISLDVTPSPPKTGQWFQYQHTGPRPWGDSQSGVSGERLIRILGKQEEGEKEKKTYWAVEESFAKDSDEQISLYDDQYLLHRQLSRSNEVTAVYQYDPPVSDRHLQLKPDEENEEQSTITIQNPDTGVNYGTIVLTRKTKRARDERMVTKAGAYLCRHFVSQTKIKYDFRGTVTEFNAQEDTYWCDQITWFVKERVEFQPAIQSGDFVGTGHVSESILVDFEMEP